MTETNLNGIELNNVNAFERALRLFAGCSLIGSVFFLTAPFDYLILLPLLGIYPCLTAIVGWDPLYYVLGLNQSNLVTFIEQRFAQNYTVESLRPRAL